MTDAGEIVRVWLNSGTFFDLAPEMAERLSALLDNVTCPTFVTLTDVDGSHIKVRVDAVDLMDWSDRETREAFFKRLALLKKEEKEAEEWDD